MCIGVSVDEEKFWKVMLSLPQFYVFGIHEMRIPYKMKLYRPFMCLPLLRTLLDGKINAWIMWY